MRMRNPLSSFAVPIALGALVAIAPFSAARAFKAPPQLGGLEEADRKALETIAGHDAPLRDAVLKASLHIDELVETQRIQEQSSASFQERIAKLDKKQQEQMWEIVREPGLLDELTAEDPQLDEIAARHPDSLAPAIRTFGAENHDMLVDVAQIHHRANERFDAALSDLDPDTQQAFRDLVDQPELLSVLVHRVNLVVRLGDSYRKNPNDTRSYLSALAADVENRTAADREEWKKRIESDPKAAEELDEAARDYADENGYDYDELTRPEVRSRVTVVVNPYPFWFGYPIWYSDAYFYPYGYWYPYPVYFGYYHHYDSFVWYGLPSLTFVNWFYFGHHYHHYGYLSNCFTHYYTGRRYAPTYYNVTVNNFVTHTDRIDRQRGGGSWSQGDRSRSRGDVRPASYADRNRGFFFNRYRPEDAKDRFGNRSAPGERGPVMDAGRANSDRAKGRRQDGRGEIRPQRPQTEAGASPGDARSRGNGRRNDGADRANTRSRDQLTTRDAPGAGSASPPKDRGAVRGRRGDQPSRGQEQPRLFQRPGPQPQREREAAQPRGRGREQEWSHAPREWSHSPRVTREAPQVEQPAASGGGERRGVEHRGAGGDEPVVRGGGDGGGSRFSGGDGGGSRGRSWGGGGNSGGGGGRGGSRGAWGGGGDSGGGEFGGGGFGGGGFSDGGGRAGGGGGRGR